jgi:hypothetical protein
VISNNDDSTTHIAQGPIERAEALAKYCASFITNENGDGDVSSLILPRTCGPILEQITFTSEIFLKTQAIHMLVSILGLVLYSF